MMAAAEIRAAWQRSANRCIVQEDAKRAPKFTCCPSSSTPQNGSAEMNAVGVKDNQATIVTPLNWNPLNPNLSPNTKWWLQQQPKFGYQKDYNFEQLSSLDEECDEEIEPSFPPANLPLESLQLDSVDLLHEEELFLEPPWMISAAFRNYGSETKAETKSKSATDCVQQFQKHKLDCGEYLCQDDQKLDSNAAKISEKTSLDIETPWKSEPWWRIADKEELALLVAQKSMELIENCDLPRPNQSVHVSASPISCPNSFEATRTFPGRIENSGVHHNQDCSQNDFMVGSLEGKSRSCSGGSVLSNSDKLHSTNGMGTKFDETSQIDPSRAELLEALRHSQTRARKAEMAAQKAYDDKEHIVKLLFRQASHIFAYKQWLRMLQLESLCLQLKIKEHQISKLIQVPPWIPLKGKHPNKDKNGKAKRKKSKCNICRNAIVFAVGLGLAGAGLLLGWTIGWLFTAF